MQVKRNNKKLVVDLRNGDKSDLAELAKALFLLSKKLSNQNTSLYIKIPQASSN